MPRITYGRAGWMVEPLVERLRAHPEAGSRLHWLEGASDELLTSLYADCSGLLMASEGEGFGLPLIEAALQKSKGECLAASRWLGMHRTTLRKKMDQYGLQGDE